MLMYIDPGLGSMIIQVIIGIVAAGSTALYVLREKISRWVGRSSKEEDAFEETEKQEELTDKSDE
jgi:hypothetical protein